jgi:hypothetical protein
MTDIRPRAAVLATVGALGVASSAYFDWFADNSPRQIRLEQLLMQPDANGQATSYWLSMAAPLAVAGAIGVLGTFLLVRLLVWLSFLVGLVTVALWATETAFDVAEIQLNDIQPGAWVSLGGLLLLLIGAAALRRRRPADEEAPAEDDESDDYLAQLKGSQ